MGKRIGAAILALLLASSADHVAAESGDDDGGLAHARLVRVKPGGKRYFYRTEEVAGCPALTARCRRKGYVLPGDVLVAGASIGAFTTVEFAKPKGMHSYGAIESAGIEPIPPQAAPPLSAWTGEWVRDIDAHISIKAVGASAELQVEGFALWGTHDPERVRRGGINTGELGGSFVPKGAWGGVLEEEAEQVDWQNGFPFNSRDTYRCQVQFRLIGPYLLVNDDGDNCGGLNVTFTGVYRKQ
jgi:hypothetical protein